MKKKTIKNMEWRRRNRAKYLAHKAVDNAIKYGRLIRDICVRCGDPKTLAHHEDYAKRLAVIWLCAACHKARHRELDSGACAITSGFAPVKPLIEKPQKALRIPKIRRGAYPGEIREQGIYKCRVCDGIARIRPSRISNCDYICTPCSSRTQQRSKHLSALNAAADSLS